MSYVLPVGWRLKEAENGDQHYRQSAENVRDYLLKGASCDACKALNLGRFPGEQGEVVGKRAGRRI